MGILQVILKGFGESIKLLKLALLFFIFNFVIGLIMLPYAGPENVGNPQSAGIALLVSIISVLIFIFLQGGALALIRDLLKSGSISFAGFIENGKRYYVRILGLFLIIIAIALVVILLVALGASAIIAIANNTLSRSLIAACITVISIVGAVLLLYPIYTVIVDDLGPIEALKKGVNTSIANFWKTFGLLLILFLVTFGIALAIGSGLTFLTATLPVKMGQIVQLFVNSLLQSYLSIVMMLSFMAFYLSLNVPQKVETDNKPSAV